MLIRVGLENGIEGRSLAWVLDFPGCFAYGKDASTALMAVPDALLNYERWITQHTPEPWLVLGDFDIRLVDVWEDYRIDENFAESDTGYEVNAWFLNDWRPLNELEIDRGLAMLEWSRADLNDVLSGVSDADFDLPRLGERWTIRRIVDHLAGAEAWDLNQLDRGQPETGVQPTGETRLDSVRQALRLILPALAGIQQVTGKDGEFWSPRKLLRRALWHERDHTHQILKVLGLAAEPNSRLS